jgi:DNA primase
VVEGPFGVFHLVQRGIPAVALLGSSMSDEQATILAGLSRPLVLMFDGNEAGQTGMRQAAAKLIRRCFVRVVKLAVEQQPDQLSSQDLAEVLSLLA